MQHTCDADGAMSEAASASLLLLGSCLHVQGGMYGGHALLIEDEDVCLPHRGPLLQGPAYADVSRRQV